MIDRHQLACRPIRDLLVDYLRERQPGMDYGSLEQLARKLGMFWADLEAHHPGIDSLHLSAEVADAWKQRMRTKPKTIHSRRHQDRHRNQRICYRECLTPVRAFYLDLSQWAVEDPGQWGPWVAPCPVGPAETIRRKDQRYRKSRMDARTRERLPVLPVLAARRRGARRRSRAAASGPRARPGDVITAAGQMLVRSAGSSPGRIWADDPATGKRRNLTHEDERAFWSWAAVEVLRATGIRIEELATRPPQPHAIRTAQHRRDRADAAGRPVQDRRRALLLVSPELAEVLSRDHLPRPRQGTPPCRWSRPTTGASSTGAAGTRPVPAPVRLRAPADHRSYIRKHARRGPRRTG